eukprot:1972537-Amphidinium_carterae.1
MATLAIEGNKRLEQANQELFDAFSACFKTVNGRSVHTWQPHEMIMLTNDSCYFDLLDNLRSEIDQLSGSDTESGPWFWKPHDVAQLPGMGFVASLSSVAFAAVLYL